MEPTIVTSRPTAIEYAVQLAVQTKTARRVWYIPNPTDEKPHHMIWIPKVASEKAPPLARLYCYITPEGEVLHNYAHIIHPFVGGLWDPACKVCKCFKGDRIHQGTSISTVSDFIRRPISTVMEIPIDQIYGLAVPPSDGMTVGN